MGVLKRLWRALKGWKTVIVNGLLASLAAMQTMNLVDVFGSHETAARWLLFITIVNIWLRIITDTPVGMGYGYDGVSDEGEK